MTDLTKIRREYVGKGLYKSDLQPCPINQSKLWLEDAIKNGNEIDPTACTLSTVDCDGFPNARVVLLKEISSEGFVFFTNYNSSKAKDIANNPNVCLNFFWPSLVRQIRIRGFACKIKDSRSDMYFNSRSHESNVAAIVSQQSSELSSRPYLEKIFLKYQQEYKDKQLTRPGYWGGYEIKPLSIEFWQGRESRMHDRIRFERDSISLSKWSIARLYP